MRLGAEGNDALFASLAQHAEHSAPAVHTAKVQADKLTDARAGGVEQPREWSARSRLQDQLLVLLGLQS